jgi:hypothetical protein
MGSTLLLEGAAYAVERATVSGQRRKVQCDCRLSTCSLTDHAERFSVPGGTAYTWIAHYERQGKEGLADRPRRPLSCPWQTKPHIVGALIELRQAQMSWAPREVLDVPGRRHLRWDLPAKRCAGIQRHLGSRP